MSQYGYLELLEQRQQLLLPIFDGVKAARLRLHDVNRQISQIEKNPSIFDFSFIHKKPGYTSKLISLLIAQAKFGSLTAVDEISKYADWVIDQMSKPS